MARRQRVRAIKRYFLFNTMLASVLLFADVLRQRGCSLKSIRIKRDSKAACFAWANGFSGCLIG